MVKRRLGRSAIEVTPISFGAFKIGRNTGVKYPQGYDLPDVDAVARLIDGLLDLGINYIDTAPAYGLSEQRLGAALGQRRDEVVLSTKVGETFDDGRSTYDFSGQGIRESVQRSLQRLRTERIDLVLIHSDGDDMRIQTQTDAVPTLTALRDEGVVRAIGLSGKTVQGARAALSWSDVLMVEYNDRDRAHAGVIAEAAQRGVGIVVKKGLASGRLAPEQAIRFVLGTPGVSSLVVGSLSLDHIRDNVAIAAKL
jgi:aryl-alcohol dehydrogenase-like predicted oxidoreductase